MCESYMPRPAYVPSLPGADAAKSAEILAFLDDLVKTYPKYTLDPSLPDGLVTGYVFMEGGVIKRV